MAQKCPSHSATSSIQATSSTSTAVIPRDCSSYSPRFLKKNWNGPTKASKVHIASYNASQTYSSITHSSKSQHTHSAINILRPTHNARSKSLPNTWNTLNSV